MTPGQAVYHDFIVAPTTCVPAKRLFAAYVVQARLDLDRLAAAVDRVVALHDSLRTAIEPADDMPVQVIREPGEIAERALRTVTWDGTPEDAARHVGALDDWWTVPRPLAVQVVAGIGPTDETLVACVFNHVCSDGISAEMVFDQIRSEYDGETVKPADVEQFAGYYQAMVEEGLRETFDDWVGLLDQGGPALPEWMVEDKLAAAEVSISFHGWRFSAESLSALAAVAQAQGCTQFEVLAGCAGLYFRRDDGRPANFGVIHSGRHRLRGFDVQGLLRSYVVDVVDHAGVPTVADAIARRRDELRARTEHFAKLPFEEVCMRTKRSPGWRAGQLGAWEIELNGMYAATPNLSMQQAPVRVADIPLSEEATCENGGPTLLLSFTLGPAGIDASVRYVSPPIDAPLAARIAEDLEATVRFVHDDPRAPVDAAPAVFRAAPVRPARS
ncbi:condensation domain-containing protein [Micromonospora sp. WMMD712]|uniref:condensation domain-containing protein n=1 Tax=Micromonospora sp. WMMD712 TaxID=3016096 RepID=UPI00249B7C1E|nr:condensation domain-containing protein [Micromonospora sp. WMMD712]WFE60220.1 condensation domain-containing protein [Micromonospora sp. WMMD712]